MNKGLNRAFLSRGAIQFCRRLSVEICVRFQDAVVDRTIVGLKGQRKIVFYFGTRVAFQSAKSTRELRRPTRVFRFVLGRRNRRGWVFFQRLHLGSTMPTARTSSGCVIISIQLFPCSRLLLTVGSATRRRSQMTPPILHRLVDSGVMNA